VYDETIMIWSLSIKAKHFKMKNENQSWETE